VTVLIKLFYAAAIAALLVLLVAFGVRAVYSPPQPPEYPLTSGWTSFPLEPFAADARPVPVLPPLEQQQTIEEQERFQKEFERYEKRRADYHRNVFLAAALLAVLALATGLALPPYLDAIRLGLVGGGLFTMLYGVTQAAGDLDRAGPGFIVLVAAVGLVLILAAGYRWLATQEKTEQQ